MKYVTVRYYTGRRATSGGMLVEATNENEAIEKARQFYNNTDDKIIATEASTDDIRHLTNNKKVIV